MYVGIEGRRKGGREGRKEEGRREGEEERERGREGRREGGKEGGREGGSEGGKEGGRERGRKERGRGRVMYVAPSLPQLQNGGAVKGCLSITVGGHFVCPLREKQLHSLQAVGASCLVQGCC